MSPKKELTLKEYQQYDVDDNTKNKLLRKFDTLDRGTYFKKKDAKMVHFLQLSNMMVGWYDSFLINGVFFEGFLTKVPTPTSNVYLFFDPSLKLTKWHLTKHSDNRVTMSFEDTNPSLQGWPKVISVSNVVKGEVFDNGEEGFQGLICYIVTTDSAIRVRRGKRLISAWSQVEQYAQRYEPTSVRNIYVETLSELLPSPDDIDEGCFLEALLFSASAKEASEVQLVTSHDEEIEALGIVCSVGSIMLSDGEYTLLAENQYKLEAFIESIKNMCKIARELNALIAISNLGKVNDFEGQTVLCLPEDPIIRLYTLKDSLLNKIPYSKKDRQSKSLLQPQPENIVKKASDNQKAVFK